MAAWLSGFEWDWFLTVTFREPLPRNRGDSVLNSIGKTLLRHNPSLIFLGMEEHASTYLHCHGLFQSRLVDGRVPSSTIWNDLFQTYGFSRVEPIRSQHKAARYVTKYCVKALASYTILTPDSKAKGEPAPQYSKTRKRNSPKSVAGTRSVKTSTGSILTTPGYQIQGQLVHRDGTPV